MIVIPAKYGSSRLPRKNFIPFYNELSLFQICCIRAKALGVTPIIISSEYPELCQTQLTSAACDISSFIIHKRPPSLARDPSTIYDVVLDSIMSNCFVIPEKVAVLLPTSPFNVVSLIREAYDSFDSSKYSRLLSVSPASKPPFNAWSLDNSLSILTPLFPESPYKLLQSTQCPTAFFSNGCLSVFSREYLMSKHKCKKPISALVMPGEFAVDIDESYEFRLAQNLFEDLTVESDLLLIKSHILP